MPVSIADASMQNPWWDDPESILDDPRVREALSRRPAKTYRFRLSNTLLLGPRQVGKTTYLKLLVRHLLGSGVAPRCVMYYSCEALRDAGELVDLVSLFHGVSRGCGRRYLLLDEVTFVEGWERGVKHVLDTGLSRGMTLYVTGSSSVWLLRGAERMPGRDIAVRVLMPQSFREYALLFGSRGLRGALAGVEPVSLAEPGVLGRLYRGALALAPYVGEVEGLFADYLVGGGFLKTSYMLRGEGALPEDVYLVYVKWVEGDLARLGRRVVLLRSLLGVLAERMTTRFSYASLARETGLGSHVTAREYVETLEGLLLLRTYHQVGPDRRSPAYRKEKKVYFTDPFLYSVAMGYAHEVYRDYSRGAEDRLAEAVVAEHLARQFRDHHPRVMFYVERGETDFAVLNREMRLLGVEVKWRRGVDERDFPNRHRFREKLLASRGDLRYLEERRMLIIPVPLLLLQLGVHQVYRV